MAGFFSGAKSLLQLLLLIRSMVNEWNKIQEEKRLREAEKKASERARIERELQRENLSIEEKRDLLGDLTNNLPY